jgi:NAD(P)-dependent dehydrogenase (short-subunit alcohol dehydrogenase family)
MNASTGQEGHNSDRCGRLRGLAAIITGAASGIGCAMAQRFAREGARLVLVDIVEQGLQEVVQGLRASGAEVEALAGDVTREETLKHATSRAVERFGALDILVNNAFDRVVGSVTELSAEDWRYTLDVCLTAVFFGVKHAIPVMIKQGKGAIINISSVNSLVANPGVPAYTAAKGGVSALTKQLAVEYGPSGIRTNAIRPGFIVTPNTEAMFRSHPDELRATVEGCPLRRAGLPQDIAAVAVFLASDDAAFVNGDILTVDGGSSLLWTPGLLRPSLRKRAGLPPLLYPQEQGVRDQ